MRNVLFFVGILAVALLVILGVAYIASQQANTDFEMEDANADMSSTQAGAYTIEQVPVDGFEELLPDLSHSIQFGDAVPADVRGILRERISHNIVALKEDPTRADHWFDLAVNYHTANDYEGAQEIWEFLVSVLPNDTVALDNLGKLYHFTYKDFAQAEYYFTQSLAVNPNALTPYLELHSLYRYSYKTETALAADSLKDAMEVFPHELGLYVTLGDYYRSNGNYIKAREVFTTGLDKARDAADVDMIGTFGREIERLPQ